MAVVMFVANFFLFRATASDIQEQLKKIIDHEATAAVPAVVAPVVPTTKDSSK
jgi:hypothetical protein